MRRAGRGRSWLVVLSVASCSVSDSVTSDGGTGGGAVDAVALIDATVPPPQDASDTGAIDAVSIDCVPSQGTEELGSSTILDKATCLAWQKTLSSPVTNVQALKQCDELEQDGFSDWRVPAPEEMATWPLITSTPNAFITAPTYIPVNAASVEQGCTTNAHSCNLAKYNNASSGDCAWQGVFFAGPLVCVRGEPFVDALPAALKADQCAICKSHVTGANADFEDADCLPFVQ